MAIVRDYYSPEGCHIIVDDSCYVNKTPEEIQVHINAAFLVEQREEFRRHTEARRKQFLKNKEVLA